MQLRRLMMQKRKEEVIDLSLQDVYGNPIKQSTANCYVVSKPGTYKFPCVYGNAIKNGKTNAAAYTNNGGANSHDFVDSLGNIISTPYISIGVGNFAQLSIADCDGVISNLELIREYVSYISFNVDEVPPMGGNVIITLGASNPIFYATWSWHIWLWPFDLSPVEITNSGGYKYNIMPVNLATVLDNKASYNKTTGWKNWFYQWGRPMPLLCPSAYNSTSNHASYGDLSFTIRNAASNLYTGIINPAAFYKYESTNYNWFSTNSSKTYNLWDAACAFIGNRDNNVIKTVYDPCPVGWKIPNGNTFTFFSTSNVVGSFANGRYFKRYSGDTVGVFFPASGYRHYTDGSLRNIGLVGSVWLSSAHAQDSVYYQNFSSSYVGSQDYNYRAYGPSIRPVEDSIEFGDVISFSINGISYSALKGMTWFEWVMSDYNTGGYYPNYEQVRYNSNFIVGGVSLDTVIIEGETYNHRLSAG